MSVVRAFLKKKKKTRFATSGTRDAADSEIGSPTRTGSASDVLMVPHVCCGGGETGFRTFGFLFFKQKTAYEIKECDWSSDVCSSDLPEFGLCVVFVRIVRTVREFV